MGARMRLALAALAACGVAFLAGGPVGASTPVATTVESVPAVGALFFPSVAGLLPALHAPHFCTASVVDSPRGDLAITAAHCVYGAGPTIEFAPGFHDNLAPHGIWSVRRIYVDPSWKRHQDPAHDVAFLQLAPRAGRQIESVTGGRPLAAATTGQPVQLVGYPMGSGGRPITCTNALYATQGFSTMDCAGFKDGTSGGPWIQSGKVVGVIGGYEQGGCSGSTSYSAPLGSDAMALFQRAAAGGAGDVVPVGFLANRC